MKNPKAPPMPESNSTFANASALIFGAAKGIGRAVALEWAARGANIAVADIDAAAATATAQAIIAAGGQAIAIPADVTSDSSVAQAIAAAETAHGPVDLLMNNVGAILNGHPEDIPLPEWLRITELNYHGTVRAITHALPAMLARQSGFIVNTASFAGLFPYAASRMPYVATKAAIIALTQSLALYCEPQGVRISCLIPGPVMTTIGDSMTSWTPDCPLRGPGSEFDVITPQRLATTLANGMQDGRILIPSHEQVWATLQRWAADPDAFLRNQIATFAAGDDGKPSLSAEVLAMLRPAT